MSIFNLICHRKPERSFHIKGYQFPVCARCTGFYLALIIYFIYAYFFFIDYNRVLLIIACLCLLPAFIDGFTQLIFDRESNNNLRFCTGIIGGLGLGILVKAIKYSLYGGQIW